MFSQVSSLLLIAFVVMFIVMTFVWYLQYKNKNAGIVDVAWAFSFPICCLIYYGFTSSNTIRKEVLLTMVMLWGARLGLYLFHRNWGNPEDARYANLRTEWGKKANLKLFLFFQFQALLAVLLTIPFVLVFLNPTDSFSSFEMIGFGLWFFGLTGETIADWQLKSFKSKPENKGKICDKGLWNYSRHPNYFFEWTVWVAYFIYALSSSYGWLGILCPILMYHFLVNVTGIKYTEEHMLATRGEAFAAYQRKTSAFFLWFNKK